MKNKQIDITEVNGKTTIVFNKAKLKGKVTSLQVLDTILMAAQMQAEYYINKLSRGSPLDTAEVKALKELGEITKLEVVEPETMTTVQRVDNTDTTKSIYEALTLKLGEGTK